MTDMYSVDERHKALFYAHRYRIKRLYIYFLSRVSPNTNLDIISKCLSEPVQVRVGYTCPAVECRDNVK